MRGPRAPSTPLILGPTLVKCSASRHSVPVLIDHQNPSHAMYDLHLPRPMGLGASGRALPSPAKRLLAAAHGNVVGDRLRHRTEPAALSSNCHRPVCRRPRPAASPACGAAAVTGSVPVRLQHVSAEELPYAPATFDCAVSTFTLCTIPDRCARCARFDGAQARWAVPVPGAWPKRRSHHRPMARSPQSVATSGWPAAGLNRQIDRLSGRSRFSPRTA